MTDLFSGIKLEIFTTNMAIFRKIKTPSSNISKDASILIYIVIYLSRLYVIGMGVIYNNEKLLWAPPHTSNVIVFIN